MGLKKQTPLGHSGDLIKINWGYLYLYASQSVPGSIGFSEDTNAQGCGLFANIKFGKVSSQDSSAFLAVAYDDLLSIQYFADVKKAWWADKGETALEMIEKAISQHNRILSRCGVFDDKLAHDANAVAGPEYAAICALAYRQSIAAHKLIRDNDGRAVFLSKECNSNGCIGTVDVSYPSIPLYLLYNPELVKGMIRPILKFAKLPVWNFDFAPHDVGRYPYAWGQVYGLKEQRFEKGDVYPPFYIYPGTADIYEHRYQMPVEECGNMLVMIASVLQRDPAAIDEFILDMPLLEQWAGYLLTYGDDPGEQLCTDDFAGHLAHNVNLSAKAIMGIAAFGLIKKAAGAAAEGEAYLHSARIMAQRWEVKFEGRDHTPLTFTDPETWGQKYNMVWDKIFGLGLFKEETYQREIEWYKRKQEKYGLPLDNRKDYTKSDWILWCAAFTDNSADQAALISPIYKCLCETPDRVPFSDWYDTVTGKHYHFKNRTVQGGLFMPLLRESVK